MKTNSLRILWSVAILLGLACSFPAFAHGYDGGYWRPHHHHHGYGWQAPYYPPPRYYAPPPRYYAPPPPVRFGGPGFQVPPYGGARPGWQGPPREYGWR